MRAAAADGSSPSTWPLSTALRLFESMFRRGSLGQLVVDYPSFRIDEVNPAFCALSGHAAHELVGRSASMLFPPGHSPLAETVSRLANGTTDGYSAERRLLRRDGTVLPVLSTVSAVRDERGGPVQILVLMQDLTRQRLTEESARRGQALIGAAITTLPVVFSTFDTELRLTFVAGGLVRPGVDAQSLVGKHATEIDDDPGLLAAFRRALAGEESTARTVFDGETYLVLSSPMRDDDGVVTGVVSISSNITAEVLAETRRRRAGEATLFSAQHDPLTGLPARHALVEHLTTSAAASAGTGGLVLLDLDDFNLINDSLGHQVGDAVLLEVAGRVSDAFPGTLIARYGGDEFAILDADIKDAADAERAAAVIEHALAADVRISGHALRVTASVGIALEGMCDSSSTLLRNADSALAHAKKDGGGQHRLYDAEMRRSVQHRLDLQEGLRQAVGSEQLHLLYQPIVRLHDRRLVGSEALMRWTRTDGQQVSPEEFIPIAEHSGLIVPIGHWVMATACRDALALEREHGLYTSVNVSARQLVGGQFADWLEQLLGRTGLPPSALTIELTESAFMEDVAAIRIAFEHLRGQGVRVSIDDFGTGYSSLARLQRLPVDVIKLDRAFVTGIDARGEGRRMAAAILELSHAIGASIVAEGVETEAEAATLLELGYTSAQGYLFARPMAIDALRARLTPAPPLRQPITAG